MRFSKPEPPSIAASIAFAVCLGPTSVEAVSIASSDCNFGFQNAYLEGDTVCVTGDLDVVPPGQIFAQAYIVVTPTGSADPFSDVTGGPEYVTGFAGGGAFFDEVVWTPPLAPGQYDLVINQFPFTGSFGPEDHRNHAAFTVGNLTIFEDGFESGDLCAWSSIAAAASSECGGSVVTGFDLATVKGAVAGLSSKAPPAIRPAPGAPACLAPAPATP